MHRHASTSSLLPADGSTGAAGRRPVGVVLAGGASRRMGRDKALLPWGGVPLARHAAGLLLAAGLEVVVADRGRALLPDLPSVADGAGGGPAAGLLGAAAARPGRPLVALGCDLPAIPVPLLRHLAESAGDLVMPRWRGRLEPLCALYGPSALAALGEQAARGDNTLRHLAALPGLEVRFVEGAELAAFGPAEELFANLNTPGDVEGLASRDR